MYVCECVCMCVYMFTFQRNNGNHFFLLCNFITFPKIFLMSLKDTCSQSRIWNFVFVNIFEFRKSIFFEEPH